MKRLKIEFWQSISRSLQQPQVSTVGTGLDAKKAHTQQNDRGAVQQQHDLLGRVAQDLKGQPFVSYRDVKFRYLKSKIGIRDTHFDEFGSILIDQKAQINAEMDRIHRNLAITSDQKLRKKSLDRLKMLKTRYNKLEKKSIYCVKLRSGKIDDSICNFKINKYKTRIANAGRAKDRAWISLAYEITKIVTGIIGIVGAMLVLFSAAPLLPLITLVPVLVGVLAGFVKIIATKRIKDEKEAKIYERNAIV